MGMFGCIVSEGLAAGPQQCREGLCHTAPPNPIAPGRPSPPPCCADGVCYPNYITWGHYATRWRRWPLEQPMPIPEELRPPPPLGPEVQPYEAPSAEEEDRRAPPPTPPRGEEPTPPVPAPPSGEAPTAAPPAGAPGEQPSERPATAPLGPPARAVPPGPTGDWVPPPSPPIGSPALGTGQDVRAAGPINSPPAARPHGAARPVQTDDPPPELPMTLANWSN
jgi:hypothetical protein